MIRWHIFFFLTDHLLHAYVEFELDPKNVQEKNNKQRNQKTSNNMVWVTSLHMNNISLLVYFYVSEYIEKARTGTGALEDFS